MNYLAISKERLRMRIQPCHLCNLINDLSKAHITVVEQMCFASVRHLKVFNIPTYFGLWLLKNYDHKTNTFNMGTRVVNITRELFRDVMGIPMGSTQVSKMKRMNLDSRILMLNEIPFCEAL
ncbi:hypothetical protein L1987_53118 [Smallanthus sonchifolius]|uniref:Uncharacterized protein n=1 Tax=Smallanthus sonchifolius TaxID=185202 RepID=A0ACB9EVS1_9ASTR|nr:hypothetical protein L1987_53118 [Smallanthus sonchifolius]